MWFLPSQNEFLNMHSQCFWNQSESHQSLFFFVLNGAKEHYDINSARRSNSSTVSKQQLTESRRLLIHHKTPTASHKTNWPKHPHKHFLLDIYEKSLSSSQNWPTSESLRIILHPITLSSEHKKKQLQNLSANQQPESTKAFACKTTSLNPSLCEHQE